MTWYSVPSVVIGTLCAFIGVVHLFTYVQLDRARRNLTFALSCFAMSSFATFSAFTYNLDGLTHTVYARLTLCSISLFSSAFILFVQDLLERPYRAWVKATATFGVLIAPLMLVESEWTVSGTRTAIKDTGILGVVYYEPATGPIVDIALVFFGSIAILTFVEGLNGTRHGVRNARVLLASVAVFGPAAVNDMLIGAGVSSSLYVMDYAFFTVLCVMSYSMLKSLAAAAPGTLTPTRPSEHARTFAMGELLGRGGFGEVYRARMTSPDGLTTEVAVKMLRDPTPQALARLRAEARQLARLRHPAILTVHGLATIGGRVSLISEFVEGMDLTDAFGQDLPARALVEAMGTVAEALDVAWETRVEGDRPMMLVHRDIKPSNLRVGRHGQMKILDFGIAFSVEVRDDRTRGTSVIGSITYMAPERFGRTAAIAAGDIYGLGCTLFEGLTHRPLHGDATVLEMGKRAGDAALHDAWIAAALDGLEVDPEVVDLLRDMLAYDPNGRPTARDVSTRCERLVDQLDGARLKTWCKTQSWNHTHPAPGALSGATLSETPDRSFDHDIPSPLPDPEGGANTWIAPDDL